MNSRLLRDIRIQWCDSVLLTNFNFLGQLEPESLMVLHISFLTNDLMSSFF